MSEAITAGSSVRSQPVYVERVNATIDYIESHLDEEMTLTELASVAHFSPYHFHRIFTTVTGETLGHFINRTRLERAAARLVTQPRRSITAIATESGFPNPSSFSRAFKSHFAMTATEWRRGGHRNHKPELRDELLSHPETAFGIISRVSPLGTSPPTWQIRCGDLDRATLTVEPLPDLEVAYVRYTGRYQGMAEVFTDIFNRLMEWAEPRGLVTSESWVLAVYHDNPSITDDADLRVSACISVPGNTRAAGDIGRMHLAGGTAAVGHFELGDRDYPQAWRAMMGWLLDSGYEPDDRLPSERYFLGRPAAPGKEYVDICLPVRPLGVC
jgi:AraC family transcriptional regulator